MQSLPAPLLVLIVLWVELTVSGKRYVSGSMVATPTSETIYPMDEHIFHATVDHYNFQNPRTYPIRYFVNEQSWISNSSSPVFFYAGNEAPIVQFINNSGFLFEIAQKFNAMVVFAEHRYYGASIPDQHDLSFLTVEQAMADFNTLNRHIRQQWSMPPNTAFVLFGGSYGANLAMWLRLKNPNVWAGAVASSATPLKHVLRETNGFARIETEVYANVSEHCPDLVRAGWDELYTHANTDQGQEMITTALGLCHDVKNDKSQSVNPTIQPSIIHDWVSDALETLVQYGYPYPTNFYNPLPAYPFAMACQQMVKAGDGLGALRAAVDVYYNYTGQAGHCYKYNDAMMHAKRYWHRRGDIERLMNLSVDTKTTSLTMGENGNSSSQRQRKAKKVKLSIAEAWGYQTCTEVYQPMPTDGVTDFEIKHTPNQTQYFENCWNQYGVQPRPNWEELTFMGSDIGSGSNIFLTNGQLDPWRAAGIQSKPIDAPNTIVIRLIENGAHHLDLRASHPDDPPSVTAVRKEEQAAIQMWIEQWRRKYPLRNE